LIRQQRIPLTIIRIDPQLKITFIFVAILFVDALQRMLKVAQEGQTAKQEKGIQDVRVETNQFVLGPFRFDVRKADSPLLQLREEILRSAKL
jgi:hypothetical protein